MREFHAAFAAAISEPVHGPRAIYRNTVTAGACEALAANFPVTRALLGDEMFAAVAADHAFASPPDSPVLAHYGAAFAEWIEDQPWAVHYAYLSDIARVERLHLEALFAADATPLDPAALANLGPREWTHARLTLHPATRFGCSPWPAASLWLAHRAAADLAAVGWRPECFLVTRPGDAVWVERLDPPGHRLLLALGRGETVAAAVDAVLTAFPGADIAAAFTLLLNRGAFCALDV